jgi:spermidine synthase
VSPDRGARRRVEGLHVYALVGLLSGFALMVFQNVFIRLGGLALGSSEFTFATVVAVFVLCIALGSFAVSLASRIPNLVVLLNQCALVGYLIFLYLHIEKLPLWAYVLRSRFGNTADDFLPFHLSTFLAFAAVIGPAAILSGAVLPLLFHHLRRETGDLGAIAGRLYSWNTVGSLLGALIGGYALLSVLDLHHVYRIAVGALALGGVLLAVRLLRRKTAAAVTGVLAVALLGLAALAPWNPAYSSWGLFRHRGAADVTFAAIDARADEMLRDGNSRVIYHDDDPIASIAVLEIAMGPEKFSRSIISNGKGDGDTHGDYTTMALAALIPAIMARQPERVFVVGFGTGVSVGEFVSLESVKHVAVAEISPAVIDAAPHFDFANRGVSSNSKLQISPTDAYRSLMQSGGLYDVISSIPPNPWVTGVEMLFSREFLTAARERLSPGGVYAQWYHQYETDEEAVVLVLRTFASVFDRVAVWYGLGADLIVLGFDDSEFVPTPELLGRRMAEPDIRAGLARSGVTSLPALLAHELLPVGVVEASDLAGAVHTLYHPILNHVAGEAFFRGAAGRLPQIRSGGTAAVGARNSVLRRHLATLSGADLEAARHEATREACRLRKTLCVALLLEWQHVAVDSPGLLAVRRTLNEGAGARYGGEIRPAVLDRLVRITAPARSTAAVPYRLADEATQLYRWFYQYPAPFDPERLVAIWKRCKAPLGQDHLCAAGLAQARELEWPSLTGEHPLPARAADPR